MKLREIETLLFVESGAPVPVVLSSEYKLNLLYYYDKPVKKSWYSFPEKRESVSDPGIAIISFSGHFVYKFGYPNDEVLQAHPYYSLGLRSYKLYEVLGSDWISSVEQMNKIHPRHDAKRYKELKHFIITFHDSTFECIALGLELTFKPQITMKEGIGLTLQYY